MKDTQSRTPIQRLAVDTLQPFKNHPFRMYSREKLAELSESIRENGVICLRPDHRSDRGHNRICIRDRTHG